MNGNITSPALPTQNQSPALPKPNKWRQRLSSCVRANHARRMLCAQKYAAQKVRAAASLKQNALNHAEYQVSSLSLSEMNGNSPCETEKLKQK